MSFFGDNVLGLDDCPVKFVDVCLVYTLMDIKKKLNSVNNSLNGLDFFFMPRMLIVFFICT